MCYRFRKEVFSTIHAFTNSLLFTNMSSSLGYSIEVSKDMVIQEGATTFYFLQREILPLWLLEQCQ